MTQTMFNSRFLEQGGPRRGDKVVIGISGGVDSAVAAALLRDRGCEIISVTTRNFCLSDPRFASDSGARSCCSQEAIDTARELSVDLGIQHLVLDVQEQFGREVIDDYVNTYVGGLTPSPCVRCNSLVRFPSLQGLATRLGADWVATGHYARILEHRGGSLHVGRGVDHQKDQSYFLYRMSEDRLARTCFPLGGLHKEEVREIARRRGLPVAEAPESQELCFVPDGDRRRLLGNRLSPGAVLDTDGRTLGEHSGIGLYTIGQRRGLGLGGGPPRYVVKIDPRRDEIVVGDESQLDRHELCCGDPILRDPYNDNRGLWARTRYRHPGTPIRSIRWNGSTPGSATEGVSPSARTLHVTLASADRAPAPGQALVLYRDDAVIGGGILLPDEACPPTKAVPSS